MAGLIKFLFLLFFALTVAQNRDVSDMTPEERFEQFVERAYRVDDLQKRALGEPTNVSISLSIISINKVSPNEGYIELDAWLSLSWSDRRLKDDQYTAKMILPERMSIWKPDFYLYNNHASQTAISRDSQVVLNSDGSIIWVPPVHIVASCSMSLEDYPHDSHECVLKFGSWVYSGQEINLQVVDGGGYDINNYRENPNWILKGVSAEKKSKIYPCCPEEYHSFIVRLKIARADSSLYYAFLTPAIFVAMLVPFQFLLHPDAKERVTLCVAVLVVAVVLLLGFETKFDTGYANVPRIVEYFVITVGVVSIALIISIFHLLMYNRGGRHGRLAVPFRKIFLSGLNSVFCVTKHDASPKHIGGEGGDRGGAHSSTRLESQMDDVLSIMHGQADKSNDSAVQEVHCEEWRQFVMVLDRVWFLIFAIVFILYTAILFG